MSNWFFRDLVGITPDPAYPAFKRFTLSPVLPSQVNSYNFEYESARGKIVSHFEKQRGMARWTVTVPPNVSAIVNIPTTDTQNLKESGAPWSSRPGIRYTTKGEAELTVELESGTYIFEFTISSANPS